MEIIRRLNGTIFKKITYGKQGEKFTRLRIHYRLFHEDGTIFIDLNERAKLLLKPMKIDIPHFYKEHIPKFKVHCLHKNELIAEKVMATCERCKPRDYFDLYYLIKAKMPISKSLISKKFRQNGQNYSSSLIFKNTNKVYNQWNGDLSKLAKSTPNFTEVMATLKRFFGYRQ